ncbi:hypothetical protein INS49_013588 [Diaporthe citri]|uniref:uncharacterized protein n=1 Tax=Diaporthe citri TaxID=83186 RepID=UPI001C816026|nr:uncharacterized protein INS49_013588 [Diaporthe citri]KAG6357709.1 hypothetical protein INS49_013588 [Diaporthe citri]
MGHAISWISGTSADANEAILRDVVTEDGFCLGMKKATFSTLAPGLSLDSMNRLAISAFTNGMDSLAEGQSQPVSFYAWVRSQIVIATTDAIYGDHNPFRDYRVENAWSLYKPGIPNLGPKALPSFLTSKSVQAREYVVQAFVKFFQAGYHEQGSNLLRDRYRYIVETHQIRDLSDLARLELTGAFASIENTVPTAFWFFAVHVDKDTWGLNADRFNHTRFVHKSHDFAGKGSKRIGFRGFGGGYHLCPGRHFSSTEMLSLAAMLVLRFDITPVHGTWESLGKHKTSFTGTAAPVPVKDFPVIFDRRDNKKWTFSVSGTGVEMELLAE